MKKLENIYKKIGIKKPIGYIDNKDVPEDADIKIKLDDDLIFYLYKKDIFALNNNELEEIEIEEGNDLFSKEKIIEEDIIYSSKIEGINLEKDKDDSKEEIKLKDNDINIISEAYNLMYSIPEMNEENLSNIVNVLQKSENYSEIRGRNNIYRDDKVSIYQQRNGVDKKIRDGSNYKRIEDHMNVAFDFVNQTEETFYHEFINEKITSDCIIPSMIGISHFLFEYIHPYFDGNGRIGRMLIKWQANRTSFPQVGYYLSEIITYNKNKYYSSMEDSQKSKNLIYFISFMSSAMDQSLEIFVTLSRVTSDVKLTKKQFSFLKKLLILEIGSRNIYYPDIKGWFKNITKQAFFKNINLLVEKGIINEQIEGKNKSFKLNDKYIYLL